MAHMTLSLKQQDFQPTSFKEHLENFKIPEQNKDNTQLCRFNTMLPIKKYLLILSHGCPKSSLNTPFRVLEEGWPRHSSQDPTRARSPFGAFPTILSSLSPEPSIPSCLPPSLQLHCPQIQRPPPNLHQIRSMPP